MSKHIIIRQSTNINVFSWLLSFFKLRESGKRNLGIKENGPKVTYLIFRRGSTGESFFFHGLIDFVLFFLHLLEEPGVLRVSVILLSSTRSKMAMVSLPVTDPAQKLISYYSLPLRGRGPHFRFEVPANHLASLFSPSVSGNLGEVIKYQHLFIPSVTFLTARYC